MVDLRVDNNHKGLTYILADYAKSVNGGKPIKMSAKQWENTMKIIAEINGKRSSDNIIYKGGSNLFGNVNENFILTKGTITFSDEEIAMILKEMGVKTIQTDPKQNIDGIPDEKPLKGLSVEKNPLNSNIDNLEAPITAEKDTIGRELNNYENSIQFNRSESLLEKFNNLYGIKIFTNIQTDPTIVTTASDTTNLAPPFEIKIPNPGQKGGDTKTISHELHTKLMKIADELNCNYEDLIAVINFESGLNPQEGAGKKNKPVGLIQFTNNAIKELNKKFSLNLTKNSITKMTAEEQIDLVEKYLKMTKANAPRVRNKKKLDAADLYSLIILPGRAGRDILCRKGETNSNGKLLSYYESNKGIDIGQDGIITRADVLAKLDEFRVNIKVV